ncbi:tetratricopeptide repeat protein [Thalassotalea sp. PS06]|uniref:tetratricopeptide repeat protein n=1 Tax=Thalassotalea sp. PS06 TaxID=2594005 RepID=UPI0011643D82|nr:tetratricopeptide repeat protein [Thalassotalea sp. PS06]QDP02058.1 tetratricopeptide repeat protein [Thalassotalea sp. PS06]
MKIQRFYILLLVVIGLLSGCETTQQQTTNPQPSTNSEFAGESQANKGINVNSKGQAIERAEEAKRGRDYERALYYYIQALEFDRQDADIYFQIGEIHRRLQNLEVAEKAYLKVLQFENEHLGAHKALGVLFMVQRDYLEAQRHLQKAISLDQIRLRQQAETAKHNPQTQLKTVYQSLDDKSPIEAYVVTGVIEDIQENHPQARSYYQLALQYKPKSAVYLSNLGYSFYLTGDLIMAERYFKRAINFDSTFKRAWSNLGLVYARQGQYERAIKTFKHIMPEHDAYNDLGYFLMLESNLQLAERYLRKAINLSPTYFEKANLNLEQVEMLQRDQWQAQQSRKLGSENIPAGNQQTEESVNSTYR